MYSFRIVPTIRQYEKTTDFCTDFKIGKGDLLFISESAYETYFKGHTDGAVVIHYRNYGSGEPTDLMVEGISREIKDLRYERVIAVGGGTILDVAKLFALKNLSPVCDLYEHKLEIRKTKKLVLVPTTCGTGSEVTNISILELTSKNTKLGLASDELYADDAVLIPELLSNLPMRFFATSSIDALIHSIESFTSPKASDFTRMYSMQAMKMILNGYQYLVEHGPDSRKQILPDLLTASTYAGIAFGNAGCAAVHAMSYPLGAAYHVPHGEANYAMFTGVYKTYKRLKPEGSIALLDAYLAKILGCGTDTVYEELEKLLNHMLPKKPLHEYGMTRDDIDTFTHTVMTKQGRLMANNYTVLDEGTVRGIYRELY
ncbi:MAG: 4-hydroxybutyrate dehydrogenase [Fusicatenibacter sp.]|nr:4-hydroxybutyrate dehydrogenase [Fusicatenibacter sp.]